MSARGTPFVPQTAVILLTAHASVPGAVAAMQDGACDYLVKPVSFEQLEQAAERILLARARSDVRDARLCGQAPCGWRGRPGATGISQQRRHSDRSRKRHGKRVGGAPDSRPEPAPGGAFVAVNCAAFPESLLESELFGHAKGRSRVPSPPKPGKFELADQGTLLLDEVGEMPLALQPKLLRALQEREFDRLGETRSMRVNLRVIATTNRTLAQMVREDKFRADLYYRLNVIPLRLPPLRERVGDIREPWRNFLFAYIRAAWAASLPSFVESLESHTWPGNVRELSNCVRRAVALSASERDRSLDDRRLRLDGWQIAD